MQVFNLTRRHGHKLFSRRREERRFPVHSKIAHLYSITRANYFLSFCRLVENHKFYTDYGIDIGVELGCDDTFCGFEIDFLCYGCHLI